MSVVKMISVAGFGLASLAADATAQVVYQGPGTYTTVGKETFGPSGKQTTEGHKTFSADGTSSTYGDTTYGDDGSKSETVGDKTFFTQPDGKTHICEKIEDKTFCD